MAIRRFVTTTGVALVLAFGVTPAGLVSAEARQHDPAAHANPQTAQPDTQNMMKMHEQMMAEMKAADAKLDALVKEMNAATGDAKVTALTAVVNELVQQHKTMHGQMEKMHAEMMGGHGMMRH